MKIILIKFCSLINLPLKYYAVYPHILSEKILSLLNFDQRKLFFLNFTNLIHLFFKDTNSIIQFFLNFSIDF